MIGGCIGSRFNLCFQNKTPYQLAEEEGHSDVIDVNQVIYLLNKYTDTLTVEQKHRIMEDYMQHICN